jgi:hypothetical protein
VGQEEVNGERTNHLAGRLDSAVLALSIGSAEPGSVVSVDVWVDTDDSLPRRARLSGRFSPREPENIVRQIDFSRFNQPVNIQAPE